MALKQGARRAGLRDLGRGGQAAHSDPQAEEAMALVERGGRGSRPHLAYCRRFDLEHTIRFMKQTLGWSAPRFRHPEQDDRWTWLVEPSRHEMRARTAAEQARVEWLKERVERRKKGTDFPST